MDSTCDVPVLFLIFNRPEETAQVFARIRDARPKRLFVAADGPRQDRPDERLVTEAARKAALAVDWDCDVQTLFQDTNQGCRAAVANAITWFFSHVNYGIVLEDDCLPSSSFFPYCSCLLEMYEDDPRVWHISGCNFGAPSEIMASSYDFCSYAQVWGWASWANRWAHYDAEMRHWPEIRKKVSGRLNWSRAERIRHTTKLDRVYLGDIDTWDYQWHVTVMANNGLAIAPAVNLVRNIGFGSTATHTHDTNDKRSGLAAADIEWPIVHPADVSANPCLDQHYIRTMSGGSLIRALGRLSIFDWRHRVRYWSRKLY